MSNVLDRFDKLVRDLQGDSSRIAKENYLKEYVEDKDVKALLSFVFNPYIITGISKKKSEKYKGKVSIEKFDLMELFDEPVDYNNINNLLDYFKYHNTGKDEDLQELDKYAQHNAPYQDLIYSIITKDLKLGVQASTLNKVFGKGFIPTFDVMLAYKYFDDPDKFVPDGTNFILTPKLDGVRCVLINTVNGKFFSRQGQLFDGLYELENEAHNLPQGFVYDGELLLDKQGLESKDLYRETMKVVSADKEKTGLVFNIFDMLPIEDFMNGQCDTPASKRKNDLLELFTFNHPKHIKDVPMLYYGDDKDVINQQLERITKAGGEGVMINIADAPYECKRTKGLLKVKKMQTADVRVVGLEEGTGQNIGKLGAIQIEFEAPNGQIYPCKVGSGLSQEQREEFWQDKNKLLGKIIEIQYFEISSNQNGTYGLRFPVFKWIREDKDTISMN